MGLRKRAVSGHFFRKEKGSLGLSNYIMLIRLGSLKGNIGGEKKLHTTKT